ncbi:N-acetyltransferase domain-containing protein [Durusdinium trenchii]|uniref:N-acetyltransferase domain-containing protein n=1 Tax=Durusdinium trenchii TaxID=1381693 RepID=A0ABP0J190_9DINO
MKGESTVQDNTLLCYELGRVQDDNGGFELVGNAFTITGAVGDIDDLKKAIKKEEELSIAPSKIDIFSQQEDGNWSKEEKMSASLRDTCEDSPCGYIVPQVP